MSQQHFYPLGDDDLDESLLFPQAFLSTHVPISHLGTVGGGEIDKPFVITVKK